MLSVIWEKFKIYSVYKRALKRQFTLFGHVFSCGVELLGYESPCLGRFETGWERRPDCERTGSKARDYSRFDNPYRKDPFGAV